MEEAFFLSYSLGALSILDPASNSPIPNQELFYLFRKSSHFPPSSNPALAPDDSFIVNYVVYHHYRSLGWCVRGGAKFSCDFMLYDRGPVFSHAEFAILIIPSYTDPYWSSDPFLQNYARGKEKRSWSWIHCINRVISQVKKKLILVYVDIPRPMNTEAEQELGIHEMLGTYKVREFVMRRWLSNRQRG
jgi:tRNA-splicing endonuclease subunit Sen2